MPGIVVALWEWCYPNYWMNYSYQYNNSTYPWTQVRFAYSRVRIPSADI